jgi:hypothetical protein
MAKSIGCETRNVVFVAFYENDKKKNPANAGLVKAARDYTENGGTRARSLNAKVSLPAGGYHG